MFFFNDNAIVVNYTATTEIYTLSLHDALPISPFRGTPRFLRAAADFMRSRFGVELDPEREVLCISGGKEGIAQLTIDRKSTRLNSSHANISYAVFCLKKQNNNLKKKLCHDIID